MTVEIFHSNLHSHASLSMRGRASSDLSMAETEEKEKENKTKTPTLTVTAMGELTWFAAIATCIKLLLIPTYRSTDFEVHRHWLALTSSLPLPLWYLDETSPWTLDYPPFFAYFERFLSIFAHRLDPTIVNLHKGIDYTADSVIYFQRLSVIVSDLCLFYGVYRFAKNLDRARRRMVFVLIVWSPALLIVDHIHFQYNGFLIGILLVSLSFLEEGRDLMGGFVFAVLLCFKHLFAVAAPVYFVYLLRHYCRGGIGRGFWRFLVMGVVVGGVFLVAFGPFLYFRQIQQVLHRMFPFGRGLCHAYWAPNFWVFYIIADKALAFLFTKLGFHIKAPSASFTGGLVGDSSPFSVLPQVTPMTTFLFVILTISPCLVKAWRDPQPKNITRWVAYAYTCGFLFGWHVHEKASLHFLIPLGIIATYSLEDARHYFLLSTGWSHWLAHCHNIIRGALTHAQTLYIIYGGGDPNQCTSDVGNSVTIIVRHFIFGQNKNLLLVRFCYDFCNLLVEDDSNITSSNSPNLHVHDGKAYSPVLESSL